MSLGSVRWLGILGLFVGPGRDWIGVPWTVGLVGGFSCGRFVGLTPFFFGAMVFPPHFFFSFLFSFCFWGLRGSEPWGCLWPLFSFLFYFLLFVDIGTFSEH